MSKHADYQHSLNNGLEGWIIVIRHGTEIFFEYLFIYLTLPVSAATCRIFSYGVWILSCGTWDLVPWSGIRFQPPALGTWSLWPLDYQGSPWNWNINVTIRNTKIKNMSFARDMHVYDYDHEKTRSSTKDLWVWEGNNKCFKSITLPKSVVTHVETI